MEKKTLLAIALSAAVFIIYYGFFYRPPEPPPAPKAPIVARIPMATPSPAATPPAPLATPMPAPPTPKEAKEKSPLVLTALETPLVKTEWSSQTGLPWSWWLKKYFIDASNKGAHIDLLESTPEIPPMGLLLFPGQAPLQPYFQIVSTEKDAVTYSAPSGDLQITQRLKFSDKEYSLDATVTLENRSAKPQVLSPGLRIATTQNPQTKKGFWIFQEAPNFKTPLYRMGTKVVREKDVEKLGNYSEVSGDISWAGLEDRYFLRAILARNISSQNKVAYGRQGSGVFADLQYAPDTLAAGQKKDYAFTIYLGPKDPSLLKVFGDANLDKAIDFGWFSFVALPILYSLKFLQSFLKNWGLAIIALTIIIKVLFNPLTKKSMQSMKAMQNLQPQLQKIREKYKDDKERLNLETMNLFKTHKVNPMGGCLPMLLQMPIYIALYQVLYNATELYHAPFFGPYNDLSASDPYFIMPIVLGLLMVLQQKMTPSVGDPAQAKMMMIMPILFTVFMLFLPVGLVLYILVNTIMTVIQQWMHQKGITLMGLIRGGKKA